MRNKFKIAAVVIAIITGMVVYKTHFDKKKLEDKNDSDEDKS